MEETIREGVDAALRECGVHTDSIATELTRALFLETLFEASTGRQLLSLGSKTERLVHYDLVEAVAVAASTLAAAIGATEPTVESVLAALGALGALKGLGTVLPKDCARLILLLLPNKSQELRDLKAAFGEEQSAATFDSALERLREIGSITIDSDDRVWLVERIVLRW